MKLRLTASGWQTYTGQMGVIFFENGLSVADVLPVDAVRVAGVIGAEWEDGRPANVSQIYLDNMKTEASSEAATVAQPEVSEVPEVPEVPEAKLTDAAGLVADLMAPAYTEEQLAEIADKQGIAGLREIADPLGLKNNSIRGLIDLILKAAGAPKAE